MWWGSLTLPTPVEDDQRWGSRETGSPSPYLGPVLERDGKVYEHLGPADVPGVAFQPPWWFKDFR